MSINKLHIKIVILLLILLSGIYFLWWVRSALYPFIISLLLAYMLNPLVFFLEKKGIARLWAIILLYISLFVLVIIGGSQLITVLIRDIESFGKELPQMLVHIDKILLLIQSQYQNSELPYSVRIAIDEVLLSLEADMQQFIGQLINSLIGMAKNSIGIVISPILTFYILHDWYEIKDQLLMLLPGRWRSEVLLFVNDVDKVLAGIIRGQLTVACIVGFFITLGLYYLQVKFFLLIGIMAAVFDVIPYFGPIIGATPAVMLALLESPWLAAKVMMLFFIIQQIEGNIIHPHIIGEKIGLHPLSVIFFIFVGEEVGGIWGMLLAVPVAAVSKVIFKHVLKTVL